jgi:DNA-binding CsgD family transcriptional regulator
MTTPQIAAQLTLSTETANWYRKRLLAKFGVNNTVSLVRQALKEQLV